ncbi:unnamed protein product [Oikopleura dioica]|uniref:Uncharacterized protein n=1 Tax=Oikopleura dioica TaxID=34765 RepID=E4Z2Z3_OIKDI|nr:unnamed protein product [Oikopleura dioica]
MISKLESDLRENQKIIEQLSKENDLERENWKTDVAKMREFSSKLESELDEARKSNKLLKTNSESQRERFKKESKKMEEEIKFLNKKVGALPGMPHFWQNENLKTDKSEARNYMKKEELKKVLHLLALGEKNVNLKFHPFYNCEVAAAGWKLEFKTAKEESGGDGYFYLTIRNKENDAKFKAIAQELNSQTGESCNKKELKSKEDEKCGERVKFKRETKNGFVNFNLTFL